MIKLVHVSFLTLNHISGFCRSQNTLFRYLAPYSWFYCQRNLWVVGMLYRAGCHTLAILLMESICWKRNNVKSLCTVFFYIEQDTLYNRLVIFKYLITLCLRLVVESYTLEIFFDIILPNDTGEVELCVLFVVCWLAAVEIAVVLSNTST